ncbi:hypothetical protein [Roseicella aerolata]|uniref:Uncharacterized protein n=1 Tax=Roseicella aerolata TaxID=2883479 RepID=A0A9X1IBL4_9PROT|nr:hypothetical protein [Roseicella aerolata]MCB4821251.1 hypothetical protein [Roseicella aerolata]
MTSDAWAEALGYSSGEGNLPNPGVLARDIRGAVLEAGQIHRHQIIRGLAEAYEPFSPPTEELRRVVNEVLSSLVLAGDLVQLSSAAGMAFSATPPRLVDWGSDEVVILGASALEPSSVSEVVRRLPKTGYDIADAPPLVTLQEELGPPGWRLRHVELGGADTIEGPPALFSRAVDLARGGDRLALAGADQIRILSGRGSYFGRHDSEQPEGRWRVIGLDGAFPAVRRSGFRWEQCIVHIEERRATYWDVPDLDLWRWAVIGYTQTLPQPTYIADGQTGVLQFHVPVPVQIRRALSIAGKPMKAWSWSVGAKMPGIVGMLLGEAQVN